MGKIIPYSLFIFLLHSFVMASFVWSSHTNIITDKSALLAFKSSVSSDPYNFLANWSLSSSSPCNWYGVTCNIRHGRVHSLNLDGLDLSGKISPHLGNLSFLVELDLNSNNFHGQLPEELIQLRRLKLLNLSYNEFDDQVPEWIGDLSILQHLSLRNNSFSGIIPQSLFNLSKLETFDLRANLIEGTIPDEFGKFKHLKILGLGGNKLSGTIPQTISNLTSLELLSLSYNTLSGSIPKEIGDLVKLRILYLGVNQLSGSIPPSIFNISLLQELTIGSNHLSGSIPKEIGHLVELRMLDLFDNHLSGSIPSNMCGGNGISKLEWLNLQDNNLSGEMPSVWHGCKELRVLSLSRNRFIKGKIPSGMGNLTQLQQLYFHQNNLEGNLSPEICHQHPLLETLGLYGNQFDGSIPNSLGNCTSMIKLLLGGNSFTGFIPKAIGNLKKLEKLDMSSNYLSGPIPTNIVNNSRLNYLDLGRNSLSGLVPSNIGNVFPNLTFLELSENILRGKLPQCLSNASKLNFLDLHGNEFSGVIPEGLGNLTNLYLLALNNNDLNGLLPTTMNKLHGLQHLDLGYNSFQGTIDEFCQLKRLSDLNIEHNMFTGLVPSCFGNLTSLQNLHLGSNKLISQIPSSLWSLQDILRVDLSSNALSGTIPFEISNLRAVILLDLSENQISGNIPATIDSLQTLQNLSLAHNNFHGLIPEKLGNMKSLEFLDLSQNHLSGGIPKSLESLLHLHYLNLSYNSLQGEIPNGGPFQNFTAQSFMMNEDLCGKPQLQVKPCKLRNKQWSRKKMLLIKCLLPIITVFILVASCIVFLKFRRDHASDSTNKDLLNLGTQIRISYYELLQATNRFNESNFLGRGNFGSVYKGTLSNGKVVAVKVFNLALEEALRSFDTECIAICSLRHRNLVKIISSCSNIDFKSLIMEFMPNGSLERWLYSHNYCLDFLQRLNIMIDVASALEYLHHGSSTPVVHCDVKPSNVLLDEYMVAHLSDFGISKLLGGGQFEIYTKTLATLGYMAPEYGSRGVVSIKGDVYSYGIMLIEMFTRKKPTDDIFVEGFSLKDWVSNSMPHSIINILDANLLQGDNQNVGNIMPHLSSIFDLALSCCTNLPETRVNMTDVVASLKKLMAMFVQNGGRTS